MQNITIGRYEADPEAQGVIKPEDGRWQLVIDKDGYPHLYVQVKATDKDTGMLAIEDMLIEKLTIRDLMDGGEFGGELSPEEEAEYLASDEWKTRNIPCPR